MRARGESTSGPARRQVPSLAVIRARAVHEDHPSLLDLRPNEWAVLSLIDGGRICARSPRAQSERVDIAKVARVITTGIIAFRNRTA